MFFFAITNNIFCSDVECAAELRDFNSLTNFGPGVSYPRVFHLQHFLCQKNRHHQLEEIDCWENLEGSKSSSNSICLKFHPRWISYHPRKYPISRFYKAVEFRFLSHFDLFLAVENFQNQIYWLRHLLNHETFFRIKFRYESYDHIMIISYDANYYKSTI